MENSDYILSKMKAVNDSHKWMWTAIAGLAMVTAAKDTFNNVIYENFSKPVSFTDAELFQTISYIGSGFLNSWEELGYLFFLMTIIYRFFVGDQRALEHYYINFPSQLYKIDNESENDEPSVFWPYVKLRLSTFRQIFDSVGRIAQYLILLGAAISIGNFRLFVFLIVLLLLFNTVYNCFILIFNIPENLSKFKIGLEVDRTFIKARRFWMFNNFIFAAIVSLFLFLNVRHLEGFVLTALVLNSIIDLIFMFRVYIPSYWRFEPEVLTENYTKTHDARKSKK